MAGKTDIFDCDDDYGSFLKKLAENAADFRVKIRSYRGLAAARRRSALLPRQVMMSLDKV